jgi:hypothetical protein
MRSYEAKQKSVSLLLIISGKGFKDMRKKLRTSRVTKQVKKSKTNGA